MLFTPRDVSINVVDGFKSQVLRLYDRNFAKRILQQMLKILIAFKSVFCTELTAFCT